MGGGVPRLKLGTWQYIQRQLQALLTFRLMPMETPPARLETTG
jgi:hypothetical protein